jgi:hypothetical protein
MAVLVVTACTPQVTAAPEATSAPAATVIAPPPSTESNPADRFAGTWTGTMSATDDPSAKADTVTTIPTGCSANEICGDTINLANGCQWEMTLISVEGGILEYNYSKTLEGECPALGDGTFTLNSDGSLSREHRFPDFTITGTLTRQSAEQNRADRFAGTWSGVMSFTDDANRKEDIVVTIPTGCVTGSVCGDMNNTTLGCQWEMTLASLDSDVFTYAFSKTMSGECPALGGGTRTLGSDDILMREHVTPDFTASGPLTRR